MKKQLHKFIAATSFATVMCAQIAIGQTVNPPPRQIPFFEDFSTVPFSVAPAEVTTGEVAAAPLATQTSAQTSTVSAAATLAPANAVQTNGGTYGYATSGNARMYVQHSASTTTGTNQIIMAINTLNFHAIKLSFDIEMINANPRTAGMVLQYRVGTTSAWINISGGVYSHSNSDRVNGQVDSYTNLALPTAAENQPVVQLRWASWRGIQLGNSSGVALDNVNISGAVTGSTINLAASSASSCGELFLSEYIHTNSSLTNRAIEIYNPTASAKSLTGYYLTISTGTVTAAYIPLSGTVASHKTWVVANSAATTAITSKANQLVEGLTYTGNQVIGLVYSTNPGAAITMIDAIGDPATTPINGYTVTALGDTGTTINHTLTRLMQIPKGNIDWSKAQFEWFAHPSDDFSFLGWHNSVCSPADLPIASFGQANYSVDINGSNNSAFPVTNIQVNLTGTWSNSILIYYDDNNTTGNYNNNGVNQAYSPAWPMSCNGGNDNVAAIYYDYASVSNHVTFFASQGSSGFWSVNLTNLTIDAPGLNFDMQYGPYDKFICLGLNADPSQGEYELDLGTGPVITTIDVAGGTVGIQSFFENKQIQIYPNPFNDKFTIENKSQLQITLVTVTDIMGREVLKLNPSNSGNISVDMSNFDRGIYFVKLNNNKDNFTVKLIKE